MKLKKFDSINVIPFIDVLLVLLAIVLLTSTFIAKGIIPVSLPKAEASNDIKIDKQITIIIKDDGSFYFNDKINTIEQIKENIITFPKEITIHIKSDKNARFELFVSILDTLKQNDYGNISIVTEK